MKVRTDRHAVPAPPRRNPKMPDETRETRLAATVETIVSAALKAEALDDEEPGVVAGAVLIGALTYSNALPVEDARWFVEDVGSLPGEALAAREVEERALVEDITATVADIVRQGRHRESAG
jgi:hypothetical protein